MDPITLISLASSLLKAGPTLIKTVGGLFGEKSGQTAVKVADAVEQISGSLSSPDSQQVKMEQLVKTLTPEEIKQLEKIQVELAQIDAEREARQLEHEETIFSVGQATIQRGDQSTSDKVAACRPNLAYISAFSGSIYVIGAEALHAIGKGDGPDMVIAGIMFALATAYMGIRHREKGQGTAT
ncbi:hypothetical protein [Photobacterium nomapromontoriensis]|uniref:hypothetical protein n=1 Tax=Photobacterium nomapromontoriensis TaxID=2910237 RepID=UPI003D0D5033